LDALQRLERDAHDHGADGRAAWAAYRLRAQLDVARALALRGAAGGAQRDGGAIERGGDALGPLDHARALEDPRLPVQPPVVCGLAYAQAPGPDEHGGDARLRPRAQHARRLHPHAVEEP